MTSDARVRHFRARVKFIANWNEAVKAVAKLLTMEMPRQSMSIREFDTFGPIEKSKIMRDGWRLTD